VSAGLAMLSIAWMLAVGRRSGLAFLAIAVAGIAASTDGLPLPGGAAARDGQKIHTLYAKNLYWNNATPQAVLDQIAEHDPDLLFLTEVSRGWAPALDRLSRTYPHSFRCAEWRTVGGSVIFSRFALDNGRSHCGDYASLGLTHGTIEGERVAL